MKTRKIFFCGLLSVSFVLNASFLVDLLYKHPEPVAEEVPIMEEIMETAVKKMC